MWCWLPFTGSMIYMLALPSISEIVPGILYLGKAASVLAPELLEEFKMIAYVLEFHDSRRKNDPTKVKAILVLQLKCDDTLGSEASLVAVEKQAIDYMDKVLVNRKPTNMALLVHCSAGVSRSAATAVHWLLVSSGRENSVADAVRLVHKSRPIVDISVHHLGAVAKYRDDKQA